MAHNSSAAGVKFCEEACPTDRPQQRIVMSCDNVKAGEAGVECRWTDGTTAPAEFDSEASTFSCAVPAVGHRCTSSFHAAPPLLSQLLLEKGRNVCLAVLAGEPLSTVCIME